ncbi:MAG: sigma-E processing peptidase SpoIIGA [Anaerovoracaceae bacterium]
MDSSILETSACGSTALCGASSFIFLPLTGALSTAIRLGAGIVTSAAAFGRHELLRKSALLLILTFLSGGAVMALLLWQQEPAITHQGIIYIDAITYFKLICFGILAFGLTYWFVALIRRKNKDIAIRGMVSMVIDDKNYDFNGYVDSGTA